VIAENSIEGREAELFFFMGWILPNALSGLFLAILFAHHDFAITYFYTEMSSMEYYLENSFPRHQRQKRVCQHDTALY
jgi:hypothetical protein